MALIANYKEKLQELKQAYMSKEPTTIDAVVEEWKGMCVGPNDKWNSGYYLEIDMEVLADKLRTTLTQLVEEAREQAIKECEGCVPEIAEINTKMRQVAQYHWQGHNSCREQTLQAIKSLKHE